MSDSLPILQQFTRATSDQERAALLLRWPDVVIVTARGAAEAHCRRTGFDAGAYFIDLRCAALQAARDPNGLLPETVSRPLEQCRAAMARFAGGAAA
jgi:hypothetical protein